MITINELLVLSNNDGLTLKKGAAITYKSGYQVADEGRETTDAKEAFAIICEVFKGNCGIWFSDGVYYIDHSFRVDTKREAVEIGKKYNQISVLKWANMSLIYC